MGFSWDYWPRVTRRAPRNERRSPLGRWQLSGRTRSWSCLLRCAAWWSTNSSLHVEGAAWDFVLCDEELFLQFPFSSRTSSWALNWDERYTNGGYTLPMHRWGRSLDLIFLMSCVQVWKELLLRGPSAAEALGHGCLFAWRTEGNQCKMVLRTEYHPH